MSEIKGDKPNSFLQRLLSAFVAPDCWRDQVRMACELWLRAGGAHSAFLVSPEDNDQMVVHGCRKVTSDDGVFESTTDFEMRLSLPFSALLDTERVTSALAESGLLGPSATRIIPWLDLAACLVVQFPQEPEDEVSGIYQSDHLESAARRLLAAAPDNPLILPSEMSLDLIAEFAAGAGHEINNPLASILGQTQVLLKNERRAECRQSLETIAAQAWRVRDMIGNAMLFARPPVPDFQPVELVDLSRQTLATLIPPAADARVDIRLASSAAEILVRADRTQISILLSQLVNNSVEAIRSTGRPGKVEVTLRDDVPNVAEISVTDDGPGISDVSVRRNLFNPFYSGRSAGRGLGFGLCLAWQIVRLHKGIILNIPPADGGTAFHIALPA